MAPLLLYNMRVFDPSRRHMNARAIRIDHGRITRIFQRIPRVDLSVERIDLRGMCLLPGFIDSHTHLITRGIELQYIDLTDCTSLEACLELMKARQKEYKIIVGFNWDESTWESFSQSMLTKKVLDQVSRHKPVIMRRVCGHCAVVNSQALQKIPRSWRIIDRATGWLYEDAALYLMDIFKPDTSMMEKGVELGIDEALTKGITSIHEIGDLDRFALLQKIQRKRGLRIRIAFYVLLHDLKKILAARLASGLGNDFLSFAGIKLFMDGSIGARTAALSRPYQGTRTKGRILISRAQLGRIIQKAERHDLQLMIHTIGDRTTALVLSTLGKYIDPDNKLRHRLEHLELLDQRAMDTIARLGIIASMQPNFVIRWQHAGGMYEKYLGARFRRMNCFHAIQSSGARLAFGSDCMPLSPLYGIQGACEHPFPCGRLSRSRAFEAYTHAGAFATREERKKGRIQEGMSADFVLLNHDPRLKYHLDSLRVMSTFVAGKRIFTRQP